MMDLWTGLPGSGKSCSIISHLRARAKAEGRNVWYHNVKLTEAGIAELGWKPMPTEDHVIDGVPVSVPQWWLVPVGDIGWIDEAQDCGFGVRPRGKVPEYARGLEKHRHSGIDLVFSTQHPSFLDSHERKLFAKHYHLMRKFGTSWITRHEFTGVRDSPDKSRKDSIESQVFLDASVYPLYVSSEKHTVKVKVPWRVVLLVALVVALPVGGYWWWGRMGSRADGAASPAGAASAPRLLAGQPGAPGRAPGGAPAAAKMTTAEYVQSFAPRVPGLAYTASAYDGVTQPVEAPYPAACVQSAQRCQCYTQQGTRLQVPADLCAGIAEGGFFVSWQRPVANAVPLGGAAAGAAVPVVPAMPGAVSLGGDPRAHIRESGGGGAPSIEGKDPPATPNRGRRVGPV